jgi:hypothetical protein
MTFYLVGGAGASPTPTMSTEHRCATAATRQTPRTGGVGAFALGLGRTPGTGGELRLPVGFAGILVDTENGLAVFTCIRAVAEAIVVDRHTHRERRHAELFAQGRSPQDADRMVDGELVRMYLDGAAVVADEDAVYANPDAVTRIEPNPDGQYVIMGGSWAWEAVDPYDCDQIVGDLGVVSRGVGQPGHGW